MAKILIADDSESMREMVKAIIEGEGHEVIACEDGQDALQYVMAMDDIELFLLDVNMPNLDGIGLTRKIRISMHYKFTPIIALTTESGEFVKKDGKSAGCTGWILKPLDPDTIIATLEDLLEED